MSAMISSIFGVHISSSTVTSFGSSSKHCNDSKNDRTPLPCEQAICCKKVKYFNNNNNDK